MQHSRSGWCIMVKDHRRTILHLQFPEVISWSKPANTKLAGFSVNSCFLRGPKRAHFLGGPKKVHFRGPKGPKRGKYAHSHQVLTTCTQRCPLFPIVWYILHPLNKGIIPYKRGYSGNSHYAPCTWGILRTIQRGIGGPHSPHGTHSTAGMRKHVI